MNQVAGEMRRFKQTLPGREGEVWGSLGAAAPRSWGQQPHVPGDLDSMLGYRQPDQVQMAS